MEDVHENGYSLKHFTKIFKLPQVVRVVSGIYDMLDEISLSREEILTLHSLKKYETVKASDKEGCTFYLPLNITSKVAIISSELTENRRNSYSDVETLADDFPPLVTSTHSHNWLELDAGDILKPVQTWISNPREGYLQCSILNKPSHNDVFIPLSYHAKFEKLENTSQNSLFLKEVVSNYSLPVQVRFLENRVVIQKHDINAGRPTSIDTLGIITLHAQCDLALVVATTIDPDSGNVHSLLNLPRDLDITIMPYPGSPKRAKKNDSRLLGFCDSNFVYGSTIIEERQLEESESHGYEDVFPLLFARKKPGAPSRFKHRYFLDKYRLKPCDNDENTSFSCRTNISDGDDFCCNTKGCEEVVKTERFDSTFVVDNDPIRQNRSISINDAESVPELDTSLGGTIGGECENSRTNSRTNKPGEKRNVDKKVSVDVLKELEKFKASLKFHYRPYHFKENSPYVGQVDKNDKTFNGETFSDDGGGEHGRYSADIDANANFLTSMKLSSERQVEADSGKCGEPQERILKHIDDSGAEGEGINGDGGNDNHISIKGTVRSVIAAMNGNSDYINGDNHNDDGDNNEHSHTIDLDLTSRVVGNDNIPNVNSTTDDNHFAKSSTDKDTSSSVSTSNSQYQALNFSTIASPETRLGTLKRLREQKLFLNEKSDTEQILHRPRSDLEGYTIPPSHFLSGENEAPRTFMKTRTLTDSFLHCAEDNEGLSELRFLQDSKSTSVGVRKVDEYDKCFYSSRSPALSPPQYNTLPASLSKKSKEKSSRKGSLNKLTIFTRKSLKRSQSTADVGKYSYAYVESVNNATSNRKTDLGKILDIRKAFSKKLRKDQKVIEVPHDRFQEMSRDRLKTLDVDQVCTLMKTLSLERYVKNFKEAKIDGNLLVDLTDEMLTELEVGKEIDRLKLRKLIDEGWLPKEIK